LNKKIKGENLLRGVKETDYKVWIGQHVECNITSITTNFIACLLPDLSTKNSIQQQDERQSLSLLFKRNTIDQQDADADESYEVKIQIGKYLTRTIGLLKYEKDHNHHHHHQHNIKLTASQSSSSNENLYDMFEIKFSIVAACVLSFFLFTTIISCFVILKRRQNKQLRQLKRMQTEFENLEMRVARECKEAFTELQMDIGELANTLNQTGAPFNDYQTFCMKILFPNATDVDRYYLTTSIDLRLSAANRDNVKNGILMFSQLILNKKFLLTFIHTLEASSSTFLLQDRVNLASYLR
jgi:hypothetical protein